MSVQKPRDGLSGGCLCGAVRYRLTPPLRPVVACHCGQCRRTSGNFVAATAVSRHRFVLTRGDGLAWFRSSPRARRGFCMTCGSNLFWDAEGRDTMTIMAGTIDGKTGLGTAAHICVADKGDYYEIGAREPQYDGTDYPPLEA